jgi:hypothetical protein
MVMDVAPGVDWTAMVAILMAVQQVRCAGSTAGGQYNAQCTGLYCRQYSRCSMQAEIQAGWYATAEDGQNAKQA